jgi:chemotaxis signal transduction protein
MLKTTPHGPNSKHVRPWPLVVFQVGGRWLAARAEEVGGVWPWQTTVVPVPSGTPFVSGIVRRGEEVLPVFDLAGRLDVRVKGTKPLCLIARHRDGPVAICIDEQMPSLHPVEPGMIQQPSVSESDVIGRCQIGEETVPIYSLMTLNGTRNQE